MHKVYFGIEQNKKDEGLYIKGFKVCFRVKAVFLTLDIYFFVQRKQITGCKNAAFYYTVVSNYKMHQLSVNRYLKGKVIFLSTEIF